MTVTNIGVQRPSTALRRSDGLSAIASLRHHWPEYLMEVGELGFVPLRCVRGRHVATAPCVDCVRQSISSGVARRALMGLVMGAAAIAIVISPWGKRSGGHFNPTITSLFIGWEKWSFGMHGSMSSPSS
jgi:aquaporin Z